MFKDNIKDIDINGLQQNKAEHQLTSFSMIAAYKHLSPIRVRGESVVMFTGQKKKKKKKILGQ